MMSNQQIDWKAEEEMARALTESQIRDRLASIIDALESADRLDRHLGTDRGGFYRDQCSVLRAELCRRAVPFSKLKTGDLFRFVEDPSQAECVKTGSNTYKVETATDPVSIGLSCNIGNRQTLILRIEG